MELLERGHLFAELRSWFEDIQVRGGHTVFVSGEAGLGKTSLIEGFCREKDSHARILRGYCDDLFAPRPLGPLYDIATQLSYSNIDIGSGSEARGKLFSQVFDTVYSAKGKTIIVIEDVHWADAATIDFIKFFGRRIGQLRCLFLLTYRDNEVDRSHPLRNVIAQLSPGSISRISLQPFSTETVEKLATAKGFNGKELFRIAGGNPFYVTEILASYSTGIPDNIRDSILSVFNRLPGRTRKAWQILSVCPYGCRLDYLEKLSAEYLQTLNHSFELRLMYIKEGRIFFKHELYRRTVESSLSSLEIIRINRRLLTLLQSHFEINDEIDHLIHHATHANETAAVVHFAPIAAAKSSLLGAHLESARLYKTTISYYSGKERKQLILLYKAYAYECYLTNQMTEAIEYSTKTLNLLAMGSEGVETGNCLRFLSRLWWFNGNRANAEAFGLKAIAYFADKPPSEDKAMAFSNMSQLMMLAERMEQCIFWGEQAIGMSKQLNATGSLSHALNNVGVVLAGEETTFAEGIQMLRESLDIALRYSYHEHAARAYTNLCYRQLVQKEFVNARSMLAEGIAYCEENDLDLWTSYMQSSLARLYLETDKWVDACALCERLLINPDQNSLVKFVARCVLVTVKIRKGDNNVKNLFAPIQAAAFEAGEMQRILPALNALLEFEWITGQRIIPDETIANAAKLMHTEGNKNEASAFASWLYRARRQNAWLDKMHCGYDLRTVDSVAIAGAFWKERGCSYDYALCLFAATNEDRLKAISLMQELGADAVVERMKFELRAAGIKKIPSGARKSTQLNPAQLTTREIEVLRCLKKGMQNKEIALSLFISAKTVEHHISSIIYKLGARSRGTALVEATRLGIII